MELLRDSKSKDYSASDEVSNENVEPTIPPENESKTLLLEIAENIQNAELAESNYNMINTKYTNAVQTFFQQILNQNERVSSHHSGSTSTSYNSFKITNTQSDNSIKEDDTKISDKDTEETDQLENHVQKAVAARSKDGDVPNLENNLKRSFESIKTNKRSKKAYKMMKKKVNGRVNEKIYTVKQKKKKFGGRLKNCNSKSTVVTRDSIADRRTERRRYRKPKSTDTASIIQNQQYRKRVNVLKSRESKPSNCKDLTKIHCDTAHKSGSVSIISQRHGKVIPVQVPRVYDEAVHEINDTKSTKDFSCTKQCADNETQHDTERNKAEEKNEIVVHNEEKYETNERHTQQYIHEYYSPYCRRNYEMPTLSSKMKRVHRSYFQRFSIHNIPFVVGTSISPSHNIGLNIQQMFSIIKTKQSSVMGISPLLIRKVSQGIRPVTTLIKHINNEYVKSCRSINYHDTDCSSKFNLGFNRSIGSFSSEHTRQNNSTIMSQSTFKQNIICEPLYEEDEETQSINSEHRRMSQIINKRRNHCEDQSKSDESLSKIRELNQCFRAKSSKKFDEETDEVENSVADNKIHHSADNQDMQKVLGRLYSEYKIMILQHEKLKEQLDIRKDNKTLQKEMYALEQGLIKKDQEVQAVVSLWNEVQALKQQIKNLNERNSLVCMETEGSFYQDTKLSRIHSRARTIGTCEPKTYNKIHRTPNALKLAGFLKQIQAFQRQLIHG